ncbi:MAG TPA: V-type ATP synthase subunit D [Candidatus Acidoferrales bacterium]|nr:V-type ATP synthase subunit D [Candidatus Acidoferrales bacterium]
MAERPSPTRFELLATKAQLMLARQGRDLLKEKRRAMMQEFMGAAGNLLEKGRDLERGAAAARHALALAEAIDGEEAVRSASFAARGEASISVDTAQVMGVRIPKFERKNFVRSVVERGYSPVATSARIDAAARRFEEELNIVVEVAAQQAALRRLAAEIQRTTRRVNALENVTLPRLAGQCRLIQMILEEREREDLFRLKRVKQKISERHAR